MPRHRNPGLTPKQKQSVTEYLTDLNDTQAAIRAGYKEAAQEQSARLLSKATVHGTSVALRWRPTALGVLTP